jgi:hypothetical protein
MQAGEIRLLPASAGLGRKPDQFRPRFAGRGYGLGERNAPRRAPEGDIKAFRVNARHPPGTGFAIA